MKIGVIQTIKLDDLKNAGGDIPKWVEPMLFQINTFIENVGRAVQGNLSFADNMFCKINTQTFTHGVEFQINPQSTTKVLGILPIDGGGLVIDQFGWTRKNNGNIGVTFSFNGGTATTTSICKILILLG